VTTVNSFRAALGSPASKLFPKCEKQDVALADEKRSVFKLVDADSISDADHEEIVPLYDRKFQRLMDRCYMVRSRRDRLIGGMNSRPWPSRAFIERARKDKEDKRRKRRTQVRVIFALATVCAAVAIANYNSGFLRIFHPALGTSPWVDPDGDFDGDNIRNIIDPDPFSADPDLDELRDRFEVRILGTNPLEPDPAVAYAVETGVDPSLAFRLAALDEDGTVSDEEKKFLDVLARLSSDLIPQDVRAYYTDEEILYLQENLVASVLKDGKVSDTEIEALDRLFDERWYVAKDIVDSGMISDNALYENWDGDVKDGKPLSNMAELLQGTNPLSNLEVDPEDLSERHAIIVSRIPFDARCNLYIYHQLKKNGYADEDIVLSICSSSVKGLYPAIYYMDLERIYPGDRIGAIAFYGKNLLTRFPVEMDHGNITSREFLDAIENMGLDKNDLGLIVYNGHGPRPRLADGEVTEQQMAVSMSSLRGRVVYVHGACQADMFLRNQTFVRYLSGKEVVFLGAMSAEETGGAEFCFSFLENLVRGYSISTAFENARRNTTENFDEHPTRHYFGEDDSWCNTTSLIRYAPE